MSNGSDSKRKGHPFLVFLLGIAVGVAGALVLPRYLPEGPWKGSSIEGTVLDKQREPERLLMRISTGQGLMLATFSQKQDDIDLLVQSGDQVKLRVQAFEPFVADPVIEHVMRSEVGVERMPPGTVDRGSYIERMESQLAEWDAEIARLRERAATAGEDARSRSEELVGDLEAKSQAARGRLAELRQATGSAWEELKSGVERAWSELEGELEEADEKIEAPPQEHTAAPPETEDEP